MKPTSRNLMHHLIAAVMVTGFFAVLFYLMYIVGMAKEELRANTALEILFGCLATNVGMIISWYFGSSSDSSRKTDLMAAAKEPGEPIPQAPIPRAVMPPPVAP